MSEYGEKTLLKVKGEKTSASSISSRIASDRLEGTWYLFVLLDRLNTGNSASSLVLFLNSSKDPRDVEQEFWEGDKGDFKGPKLPKLFLSL